MAEVTIPSTPNLQRHYLTPHFNDNNINDNNNENDNDDNNLISFISLKNVFDWQRYQFLNVNVSEKKKWFCVKVIFDFLDLTYGFIK